MDVRKVEYFRCVCEAGSITAAAERLSIARPSLSAAIGSLERELGVVLFKRGREGVVPTEAGEALLSFSATYESALSQLYRAIGQDGGRRTVTLGCTGGTVDPEVIAKIYDFERLSSTAVEVVNRSCADFWESVRDGGLDLAITVQPPAEVRLDGVRIAHHRQYLIVCRDNPLSERGEVDFTEDLAGVTLLETEGRLNHHLARLESLGIRRKMVGEDRGFIKQLVALDHGCVMTIDALLTRYESENSRTVPVAGIPSDIDLDPYLVYRPNAPQVVLRFANHVLTSLGSKARL